VDPPHLPGWHDVPLRDAVIEQTGLPAILDKDVIPAASAYLWNPGEHRSGEVVRGVSGKAGESGHFVVDPAGPLCWCGKRGRLGAALRAECLVEQGVAAGLALPEGVDRSDPRQVDVAFSALCAAADDGDPRAIEALETAGQRLAMGAVGAGCLMLSQAFTPRPSDLLLMS